MADRPYREEHEDALLHENLLCLKALCTTDMAMQYLHSIHATLFPALLHMIFDPEKKGPSEFTTRNIIISILFTYIEAATPRERIYRARAVLGFLRDPQPKEEDRPVDFVLEMRRERPYRVWCKEAVNVTKEVFWIFLHNLNIVALPSADKSSSPSATPGDQGGAEGGSSNSSSSSTGMGTAQPQPNGATGTTGSASAAVATSAGSETAAAAGDNNNSNTDDDDPHGQFAYMARHFPQERPPVPAAPYVGGVEWDATNYLASHLDLMNAILACTGPGPAERNALRAELRVSGWERCLGGSLRLCKEKFYGAVHDGLRTWVAAAAEDGWDVRDVRFGPPPEKRSTAAAVSASSPAKKGAGNKKKKQQQQQQQGQGFQQGQQQREQREREREEPPRVEIPRLDFDVGGPSMLSAVRANEPWLA